MASSHALGESGVFSAGLAGVAGATGGVKRARDRRADRRKKKDPFEALEERLLDGFSVESITKQLQQQDETLQKGVRRPSVLVLQGVTCRVCMQQLPFVQRNVDASGIQSRRQRPTLPATHEKRMPTLLLPLHPVCNR